MIGLRRSEELLKHNIHAAHHLGEQKVVAETVGGAFLVLIPSCRSRHAEALRRSTALASEAGGRSREKRGGSGCEEARRSGQWAAAVAQERGHGSRAGHGALCVGKDGGERKVWWWRLRYGRDGCLLSVALAASRHSRANEEGAR